MKVIAILLTLTISSAMYAQDSSKTLLRNSIEIEAFSPITPMNNEYLANTVSNVSSGQGNNIYMGTCLRYNRTVGKITLSLRAGMMFRNIEQVYKTHTTIQQENFADDKYTFNQKDYLFSIGLNKEERIKDLAVNIGLEMIYIYYGKSTDINSQHNYSYYYGTTDLYSDYVGTDKTTTGSGFATGAGFGIGVSYYISRHLKIIGRLSEYFLATTFSKPIVATTNGTNTIHFIDGTPDHTDSFSSTTQREPNSTQVGFSRLVPSIGLVVSF